MSVYSFIFFVFIVSVALAYYAVPKKYQWLVLLLGSYVYYWSNSKWLVVVLFFSTLITFLVGRFININSVKTEKRLNEIKGDKNTIQKIKAELKKKNRIILFFGVASVLSILLFLKYYNFFANNSNKILLKLNYQLPHLNLFLPLGISFYTLQAISYMVDVYRGKIEADDNLFKFMLFMSYFPQIIQGPIPRYKQLARQLYEKHEFNYQKFTFGLQLILWGLIKKLVIADRVGIVVDKVFDKYTYYKGPFVFFIAIMYGIQVYTDFSGGMDIVGGVSQLFGIELEKNFKQPFHSTSIEEFWRRWHITLGAWMKDYVFYPLSLSRVFTKIGKQARKIFGVNIGKKIPAFISMFIVYFLVGFWHGPYWKYVAYGLYNGFFIMFGILFNDLYDSIRKKLCINDNSSLWKAFRFTRTIILISFGRYFSRANGLKAAITMIKNTFIKLYDFSFIVDGTLLNFGLKNADWCLLAISIIVLLFVDSLHERGVEIRKAISEEPIILRWIVYIVAILFLLIFGIYGPAYNAASFIYEQF